MLKAILNKVLVFVWKLPHPRLFYIFWQCIPIGWACHTEGSGGKSLSMCAWYT